MTDSDLLFENIAADVRSAILTGEYPMGYELRQETLASKYGVSRMPIRQVLLTLADEELITLRKNRSAIVNEISNRDIEDHFGIRGLLEGEAAALATKRGADFSQLRIYAQQCVDAIAGADKEAFEKSNYAFHQEIWRLADNKRLQRMIMMSWNTVSYVKKETPRKRMSVSAAEHMQILLAMEARKADQARERMYSHIVAHNLSNFEIEY